MLLALGIALLGGAGGSQTIHVRGESMAPLVPEGSQVEVISIGRAPLARNDLVTARVGRSTLLKVVKAVPGDSFEVRANDGGTFAIVINGAPAVNSTGQPYAVPVSAQVMLSLYVRDYQGVIPPDTYMLLGDRVTGTRDSTSFGLVHRDDIVGKVVRVKRPR